MLNKKKSNLWKRKKQLEESIKGMEDFKIRTLKFIKEEENRLVKIKSELEKEMTRKNDAHGKTKEARELVKALDNKHADILQEQRKIAKKKNELVDLIKPSELSAIKIESHLDTSNDIFKWIIQAVYKEPKRAYEWKNFKEAAFVIDKGEDFLVRLKCLPPRKLRKEDFVYGKDIFDRREEILFQLEHKGKPNPSLRYLFTYIGYVVEIGSYYDQIASENELLNEFQKDFEKKAQEEGEADHMLKVLDEKIRIGTHITQQMKKMLITADQCIEAAKKRIECQQKEINDKEQDDY